MVSKVGGPSSSTIGGFPSAAELKKQYAALAQKAIAGGAKPMAQPPQGIEKYSSVNITPKGEMGVSQKVYTFKGNLYLQSTPVAPDAKSTWTNIGPMPMY
jgi:hypothetical protein